MRMTARSVSGSSPMRSAGKLAAVGERDVECSSAPWTTWLLVRMRPSGVKTNPEPCPPSPRRPAAARPSSMVTTDGPTVSTALTTACEYASRSSCSRISIIRGAIPPYMPWTRNSRFRIFPVALVGSSLRNSMRRGYL